MSVAMLNCQSWQLDVSTRGVYLIAYLGTPSHILYWSLHLTSSVGGGISDSWSGYIISHLILVTSSDKFSGGISDSLSGYFISHLILVTFIWQLPAGCWGRLHLTWLYNANWMLTNLIIQKKKEILNFSWRIQNDCQIHPIIYIPWCIWRVDLPEDLGVDLLIAILDHLMSVAMWNCHSWWLDISSNVKLPFLMTRYQ